MPAANLPELFDFEAQFERAAQAVLERSGVTAYLSQQEVNLPLLNTGIGFDLGPALDQLTQIPAPATWPAGAPPPQEYYRYTGQLEFGVEVPRDDQGATLAGVNDMMAQVRGQIRAAMMLCAAPFRDSNLPYYRVSDIRPNATSIGFNATRNIDFCTMRFALTFQIQPSAWPAWILT